MADFVTHVSEHYQKDISANKDPNESKVLVSLGDALSIAIFLLVDLFHHRFSVENLVFLQTHQTIAPKHLFPLTANIKPFKPFKSWQLFDEEYTTNAENSIFFVESDPSVEEINPVSQCALESTSILNPEADIFYVVDSDSKMQVKY